VTQQQPIAFPKHTIQGATLKELQTEQVLLLGPVMAENITEARIKDRMAANREGKEKLVRLVRSL